MCLIFIFLKHCFLQQICSDTKDVHRNACRYTMCWLQLPDFTQIWNILIYFCDPSNIEFHESPLSDFWTVTCRWMCGHSKANTHVCIFLLQTYQKGSMLLNDGKQQICCDFASLHDHMALVDDLIFVTVLENLYWNWVSDCSHAPNFYISKEQFPNNILRIVWP